MKRILLSAFALAALAGGVGLLLPPLREHLPVSNPRVAHGRLKTLLGAQEEYRRRSASEGRPPGYWRDDIAHLGSISDRGRPIQLIDSALAGADDRPRNALALPAPRAPLEGYWYRSVRLEGESEPGPDHLALCAFPDDYPSSGRHTLIATESGVVWARDLGRGRGVEAFPRDPVREGWTVLAGP